MAMTVAERGRTIATLRFVEVRLMEIAAAWTPATPEMEAKVLFGRHIWEFAQNADALGKRTFELRLPLQHSRAPVEAYAALLAELAATADTSRRLQGLYEGLLPGLCERMKNYVAATDTLLDAPSVVVLERILQIHQRQREDARRLRQELGWPVPSVPPLAARESAIVSLVEAG